MRYQFLQLVSEAFVEQENTTKIGCNRKSEPHLAKGFLGDNGTEFIKILLIVTYGYY